MNINQNYLNLTNSYLFSIIATGVRREITTDLSVIVVDIRKVTDIPIAIGFGISTPEKILD